METAVCIANGPSLCKEDAEYCRDKASIYAVKEAVVLCPWADALYAADTDWWDAHRGYSVFNGEKWTVSNAAADRYGLNHVLGRSDRVWSDVQGEIATGGNSGFQALNLAALHGAKRIILIGYDMGHEKDKPKHWWTGKILRQTRGSDYKKWIEHMNKAAPHIGAEVINCSRVTNLTCFKKADLRDVL